LKKPAIKQVIHRQIKGYAQVMHRILTGYSQVIHTPPPATSCAQGPEGEGEVPLTRGGNTLFDIRISIWNI
jgi:hypothetical protein